MLEQAISSGSQISVTVGELFAIAAGVAALLGAVIGVYQTGKKRDDAAARRIDDLERWYEDAWKGGAQEKGGYKQIVDSLRYDQIHGRGAKQERRKRETGEHPHASKHKTMGPGHDTQT